MRVTRLLLLGPFYYIQTNFSLLFCTRLNVFLFVQKRLEGFFGSKLVIFQNCKICAVFFICRLPKSRLHFSSLGVETFKITVQFSFLSVISSLYWHGWHAELKMPAKLEEQKRTKVVSPVLPCLPAQVLLCLALINTHVDSMNFWRIMKRFSKKMSSSILSDNSHQSTL